VSNTLLLSANPRYFDQVKSIIEQLDQPQPQVLIQVLLAEVTLDSTRDLGIEWDFNKMIDSAAVGASTAFGVPRDLAAFGGLSATVTGSDYGFLLRALENDGRLEVLSRPQILTADNKPANINIGQRVPLITDSRVTQFGDTINSFQYENVGVSLRVTPRIGPDGSVQMEIGTTNSALSSSSVDIATGGTRGGTVRIPIINQRLANTSVSVQSGQSILIGGLISTTDDTRLKKVPVLGDIPWLGMLFRSRTKFSDRKELLILLTPQVLLNALQAGKIGDPNIVTREQLDRSQIRNKFNRDELQKQLLDPLFPDSPDAQKEQQPPKEEKKDKEPAPRLQPVPNASPL
jgi:type II secretory pathway component GspD/PulD (secretin)